MSPNAYKVLHLAGVVFLFLALGGSIMRARAGGGEAGRKLAGITHGIALLVILVAGFGSLAKLGLGFEPWVWVKIIIWLLLGAAVVLIRKMPERATLWWVVLPLLGVVAAWLGIHKSF